MPAAGTTQQRAAPYADLEAVPPNLVAEILFGVLIAHPRPVPGHAAAQSAVSAELGGPFQCGRGGPVGWIYKSYALRDGHYFLHETFDGDDAVKAPPFDAVPFPLSALWPLDPAPVQS